MESEEERAADCGQHSAKAAEIKALPRLHRINSARQSFRSNKTMYKLAVISLALVGCASKPIIEMHVAEKPVPVFCQVETPAECKDAFRG